MNKTINSNENIPAGSTEYTKTKNIYDLAGNVYELTTETSSIGCIFRGGAYNQYGGNYPVSFRDSYEPSVLSSNVGFRVRLYIKYKS